MTRILVACEESQEVCKAFRERGFEAFSCDFQPCSGGRPEWHIRGDVMKVINGECIFNTEDGARHMIAFNWDLIIAHPPCTYLTGAGACNIPKHPERIEKGFEAAEFFKRILNANCDRIAVAMAQQWRNILE